MAHARTPRLLAIALIALAAAVLPPALAGDRVRAGGARSSTGAAKAVPAPRSAARSAATARGRATYGHRRARAGLYPYQGSRYRGWYGPSWYAAAYGWPSVYGSWGWPAALAYGPVRTVVLDREAASRLPSIIEFDVRPRRADVFVDGELVGEARDFSGRWDRLELTPGPHVIELVAEGRQTLRRVVDLRPGEWIELGARLRDGEGLDPRSDARPDSSPTPTPTPTLRRGLLRLDVSPGDAAVYLDGEFLAHAGELARLHGAIPVAAGTHRLEVVRPGFEPQRVEIDVEADERRSVEVVLVRASER